MDGLMLRITTHAQSFLKQLLSEKPITMVSSNTAMTTDYWLHLFTGKRIRKISMMGYQVFAIAILDSQKIPHALRFEESWVAGTAPHESPTRTASSPDLWMPFLLGLKHLRVAQENPQL